MKTWFTKEFMKASAVLLIVFAAGAGTGYVGGQKYAEYKFQVEYTSRDRPSRIETQGLSAPRPAPSAPKAPEAKKAQDAAPEARDASCAGWSGI